MGFPWTVFLILSCAVVHAAPAPPDAAAFFKTQGWSCAPVPAKNGNGLACRGKLRAEAYPEEMMLTVPPGFRPKGPIELILHMHGHLGETTTFDDVLHHYHFEEMLARAGRHAILAVPFSLGKEDTFLERFTDEASFSAFLDGVMQLAMGAGWSATAVPDTLTLTGHSGAYKPIAAILAQVCEKDAPAAPLSTRTLPCYRDRVREVHLFDALYGSYDVLARYAQDCLKEDTGSLAGFSASRKRRFLAVTMPGTETHAGSREVWRRVFPEKSPELFDKEVLPPDVAPSALKGKGLALVASDQDHWDTLIKYFPIFLAP